MSDVSTTSSAMTGAGGGNKLRILGMSTGLDVDATVKKMLTGEQTKLDKAKQAQQTIQWKQEAYQDIIKDVKDLQSSFFDVSSSDKDILSSANFSPFTVGDATGDTSAVTFTPDVGAKTGNYSIHVNQLASAAINTGSNIVQNTSEVVTTGNWKGKSIKFSIGGAQSSITLSSSLADANAIRDDINNKINLDSNLKGKVQAVVTSDNKIQFQGITDSTVKISDTDVSDISTLKGKSINTNKSTTMADLGLNSDSTISFNINGSTTATTVTVKTTDKISDVINNIVTKTSGAVTASFSQLSGTFSIQTASTGSSKSIQVAATDGATALGLTDTTLKNGTDAIVKITPPGATDGTTVVKSTNNFTIDGMNYNLSSKSSTDTSVTTVSVSKDSQKVYDKIKGFIDKYNTVVDKIQTKLNEKKSNDYKPLTDSQKESMSDSQITTWETKAKVGILRNDDKLQIMLNDLRTSFTTAVNNAGLSFGQYGSNSIGLDTSTDYDKPAHIDIVDPTKLKAAISSNSDQILKMFTNVSDKTSTVYTSNTDEYKEDGIFTRIKSILETNVGYANTTLNTGTLTSYANKQYDYSSTGSGGKGTIPDQLYEQQLLVKKITTEMSDQQERYYKQFSALETAMTTLNAQQSQLSSMLGS